MIWLLLVVLQFGGLVYYLLQKTLVTRKPLVEVSIVHSSFSFCIIVFVFFFFFKLDFPRPKNNYNESEQGEKHN